MRYRLARDDDSHWYYIPADKVDEWNQYVESSSRYWRERNYDAETYALPEWARPIGGSPTSLTFTDPREMN